MTLVVLGIDALDPRIVEPEVHPHLVLNRWETMETIPSIEGTPHTHEMWPTIISGLTPEEHGITLDGGGVSWSNPLLNLGSNIADHILPDRFQTRIGSWFLNNTNVDTFRKPASYYQKCGISTIFDGVSSKPIGIPNYVTNPNEEDREHVLRRRIGEFMHFDPEAKHSHTARNRSEFYELCMEMVMIRFARTRRAVRSRRYELVFGYTSGIDLIGHVAFDSPAMQHRAYQEVNEFVGEVLSDLESEDDLLILSDHGLRNGIHTNEAMVAGTLETLVDGIDGVTDVYGAIRNALAEGDHRPSPLEMVDGNDPDLAPEVLDHLQDLGYI